MTFAHAWVLALLALPLAWLLMEWRTTPSRSRLLCKALAVAAVIAALAEPEWRLHESKVGVVVLADTSASVSDEDLRKATALAGQISTKRGRNWVQVIPFAGSTRALQRNETQKGGTLQRTSGEAGRATDLEGAVRQAIATLPSGLIPHIVLVSDGNENQGSVTRAAWQAQQLGIPIDTYALAGRPQPALRLESASIPGVAFTGEKFPIDLLVTSPRETEAVVEIAAEGKTIGSNKVQMQRGTTPVRIYTSLATPGAIDLSGAVRTADGGEARFEQAVQLRRPKVLYLSQDPAGTEQHLMGALEAGQFDIQRAGDFPANELADYQMIVLNNWDLEAMPPNRKEQLEQYVKRGGGLLVIGGEKNVYKEGKTIEDALDRVLPAKIAPPRSPEGTGVVLIIDKSSSMEGRKIELARLAAIGVVENLKPTDYVGVLIFDNSFQWAVPMRKAEDKNMIKRLIAGITPDGGTQIAPALTEAYRRVLPLSATYKHIVLLTDGISEEGDSMTLSKEAADKKVTISTVGLGQDVNRAYLEKVAAFAKGKSYFLNDPSGLEQILLKDVMEHTGTTTVEKPIKVEVAHPADVLAGVQFESAPPLKGYVKYIAKPTADTILKVDQKEPLLARWQYGLGRAAVFASDAKSRWATQWVEWNGFDRFWTNVFRDLLPHAQNGEAVAEYDEASGKLLVHYQLGEHVPEPASVPDIYVFGPNGFRSPIPVRKAAEGTYRGELVIGNRQGLFRVRPLAESAVFPEIGLYRQEEEMTQYGSNKELLKQVASFTGGRFEPPVSDVFRTDGQGSETVMELWPGLLGMAVLLSLVEVVLRKWRTVRLREPVTA